MRASDRTQPHILNLGKHGLEEILPQLLPYLLVKRNIGELILQFCGTTAREDRVGIFEKYKEEILRSPRITEELLLSSPYMLVIHEDRHAKGKGTEFA
jgi:hypothetical protein